MLRAIQVFLIAVVLNCSYYSFEFAFWYGGPNTKMLLAVLGVLWYVYDGKRQDRGIPLSPLMLVGGSIAIIYSIINLVSIQLNNTFDYSYANYLMSFITWIFSTYPAIAMMRMAHGRADIKLVTLYLAGITLFQCVSAILIDKFAPFKEFTLSIVWWNTQFFAEIDRLYCFSTALDPAGTRFALVLILIMAVICVDEDVKHNKGQLYYLLSCFFVIIGLGNIVARTTFTGGALALVVLGLYSNLYALKVRSSMLMVMSVFSILAVISFGIGVVLYNTSEYYHDFFRFAFEGFFNFFERGEFKTDSTDVLDTMWIWPKDDFTWMIGTGLYAGYLYNSDIGYCRLILYSGLIGFSTFASMFLALNWQLAMKYRPYWILFLAFAAMSFIIWIKVSTDTMMMLSLFFWFTDEEDRYILSRSISRI